jgi:hypothetical protein
MASCIITDSLHNDYYTTGVLQSPGSSEQQSAFLNEVTGIYAIVTMFWAMQSFFSLVDSQIEIGCDGKGVLYRLGYETNCANPMYVAEDFWFL